MQPGQLGINQQSTIKWLKYAYDYADQILTERGLRLRTKNLDEIKDPKARAKEWRRQNFSKYAGEQFDTIVTSTLSALKNSEELLHEFDYIDLHGQDKTSANVLELRMLKIRDIIAKLERHPEKYIFEDTPLDKNISYRNSTGELRQHSFSYAVKDDAKVLIDYLWGKRKITFVDRSPTKIGRPVTVNALLNNTGISSADRLKNIIDNFNNKTIDKHIAAKIRRGRSNNTVQLEVLNEFPTSS